jgi:hypothetical protein
MRWLMPAVFALPDVPPEVTVQVDTAEVLPQIAAFLAKHPGLREVLYAGIQRLHQTFPESSEFLLALEEDPEIAGWESLVVLVKASLPVDTVHARLTTAFDPWWLEHIAQFGNVLLFDVEYV